VSRCYKQGINSVVRVEFCKEGCGEWICKRETDDSPVLEAVPRERLMKTLQAGNVLEGAVMICGDVITCSSESCVQMVNKSIHQTKPRL
jgi:hypothetical protein